MPFHFALQTLLRARESLERLEEAKLAAMAAEVARLRAALEQCRGEQITARSRQGEGLRGGWRGAELEFTLAVLAALRQREAGLTGALAEAEARRVAQQAVWRRARRDRRALEQLRDQRRAEYERERERRAQQALDDLHLMRRGRKTSA